MFHKIRNTETAPTAKGKPSLSHQGDTHLKIHIYAPTEEFRLWCQIKTFLCLSCKLRQILSIHPDFI